MPQACVRQRLSAATVLAACLAAMPGWGGCGPSRSGVLSALPDPVFASRPAPLPQPMPLAPPSSLQPPVPRQEPARGWRPGGGISNRWECIVIHHSATTTGCARQFDRAHKGRGWDGLGYHFVIGNGTDTPNGRIEVGSRWLEQKHGAHCKTPDGFYNQHGIGICLVGNFEERRPSRAQMDSLVGLVAFLMAECDIPLGRVHTHGGITGRTLCPGRYFPLAELKRRLAHRASPTASGGP